MRSFRGFLLGCIVGLITTVVVVTKAGSWGLIPPPSFPKGRNVSLAITLFDDIRPPTLLVTTTDPAKIESLATVLRRARSTSDHKCGDVGRITFRSKNGSETVLTILAGHHPRYYEYRAYHPQGYENFRVDRAAFLRAMAGLGVTRLPLRD